jgi:hypothetical protein
MRTLRTAALPAAMLVLVAIYARALLLGFFG